MMKKVQSEKKFTHIRVVRTAWKAEKDDNCGRCQTSCQSACKTSCTVANQTCKNTAKVFRKEVKGQ